VVVRLLPVRGTDLPHPVAGVPRLPRSPRSLGPPRLGPGPAPTWSSPHFLYTKKLPAGWAWQLIRHPRSARTLQLYAAAGVGGQGRRRGRLPHGPGSTRSPAPSSPASSRSPIIHRDPRAAIGGPRPADLGQQGLTEGAFRPVAGAGAELLFAFGLIGASALAGGRWSRLSQRPTRSSEAVRGGGAPSPAGFHRGPAVPGACSTVQVIIGARTGPHPRSPDQPC